MTQLSILISTAFLRSSCKNLVRCFTAISTVAVLLVVPVSAQRGGGARGAGIAARPGIGAGQVTTGHSPGGMAARPNSSARGFSHQPSMRPGQRPGHSHGSNSMLQSRRFRNKNGSQNCWGWQCWGWAWASPWWGWGPSWDGYDSSSDYYDHNRDRDYDSEYSADRQNYEDARMAPPWAAYGYPSPYAPQPSAAPRAAASESQSGTPILPPTLLVFRDRHVVEIQNYAIVGQTLWNFAPQHIEKISLTEIDVPATVKANNDRGRSFRVPSTGRSASDTQPVQNNT